MPVSTLRHLTTALVGFVAAMSLLAPVTTAIPLLNGRFETTTDVQDLLNLALDAADMKEATEFADMQTIYTAGVQRDGQSAPNQVTLQSLSLDAKGKMSQSPLFNIFRHAFLVLGNANEGETEGSFDGHPIEQYGDTLVNDLFSLNVENVETEAALVTSVWMAAVHELFQVLQECKASDKTKGLTALDRAAALWIGEGQVEGSNEEGHLLYNLAENSGERFDQDDGEAEVNTQLLNRFAAVQTSLNGNSCDSLQGYIDMRTIVRKMIGLMTVPLIQNLIHHSKILQSAGAGASVKFVELYALATIPRVAACNPSVYDEELHMEVLRDLKPNEVDTAIANIQKSYSCLGITCADVGTYLGGVVPACTDDSTVTAAGYTSSRAGAQAKSDVELDIKAIDIFLRFEAYGAAEDWYTHGWNADGYSLQALAQNQLVPTVTDSSYITTFQNYYAGDNFADTMITNLLDLVPPYNSASKEQVRNMVIGTLTNVVMFMTSATSLQYAVQQCETDKTAALDFWDTGAYFYIGSMEGEEENGNPFGGELLYSTAKELCSDFGTCTSQAVNNNNVPVAAVNNQIVKWFKEAVDSINAGSCDEVQMVLDEDILPTMIIPLIQGTIKYASYNAGLQPGTSDSSLAIGDTFAKGILPIVDSSNSDSATTLTLSMEFQLSTQPVPGGFVSVADAMRTAFPDMPTSCSDVGVFKDEPTDGNMCGTAPVNPPTAPTAPPPSGSSGQLGWGRYTFQNADAKADAGFALDVRDMFQGSVDEANTIYYDGENMKDSALFLSPHVTALAGFSLNMTEQMMLSPMFNIYRYALYEDSDLDDMNPVNFTFGDDVVWEAITGGKDNKLASQAAVVMNVWMIAVHRLYEAQGACEDPDADATPFVDSAVALWLGEEQKEGKFDAGWMLYDVAQTASKNLGNKEGEAKVNTELMKLFNQLQAKTGNCDTDEGQFDFYFLRNEIIRALSKILVLGFFSHLFIDGTNMVELFAVSIFPQAYACEEAIGDTLENLFALNYDKSKITDDVKEQLAAFLRCQRITFDDLMYGPSVSDDLSSFLLSIDNRLNYYTEATDHLPMAGYEPNSDVSELARMDLDATMIKILMYTQAYEAAKDVFLYGLHAFSGGDLKYVSFKDLLDGDGTSKSPIHKIYTDYYSSASYAEDLVTDAMDKTGPYAGASRIQRADIVFRYLQTMVSFTAMFGKMQDSVISCQNDSLEQAQSDWDSAVALFIGSTEGLLAGGRQQGGGAFMYSLSEEVCDDFGQCQSSGETAENEGLLLEFASGRDAAKDGKCAYLTRIIKDEITSKMAAVLVQGFLDFAVKSQDTNAENFENFLVAEHVAAKAILPLVDKVNSASSSSLETILGDFSQLNSAKSVPDIVDAVANALRGMGIDCKDIGTPIKFPTYTVCLEDDGADDLGGNVPDQAPLADTPTDLGDGLYVTTTYVQDRANIAKDFADLKESLSSNNFNLAKLVYEDGKNSEIYDENGKFVSLRSLKAFSTEETNDMQDEPLFNIFLYGLQNNNGRFMSRDVRLYADSLVEDAFNNVNSDPLLPVEAALALNLWMHTAHVVYKTLKDCKNQEIKDEDGIHSIDIAVAYWIGDGQVAGSGDAGHLLYAFAERMGELFNMDKGGQSRTNTNILKLFNQAKHEITLPGACSESPSSYLHLSRLANNIVSLMAVPLIQSLIHNLRMDDRARVKLYAHAVVPLAAGCGPGNYEYLKGKLFNVAYNAGEIEDIVTAIRSIYPCLGLTCDDIGVHETEMTDSAEECRDPDPFTSLAGYKPASDVGEFSRLDLDIRQLEILMEMKAYAAAENLYTYGKHVKGVDVGSMSLFHLASTSDRKLVPEYDAFIRYYGNTYDDPSIYADHIIRSALNGSGRLQWTEAQRKVIVLKAAQVMVMYFGSLQALYEAVSDCQSSSSVGSAGYSDKWDRGAALLIGSLEGAKTNGTEEGYMYYDLAQDYCKEFNTCSEPNGGVTLNERLVSLLYTGRGAALGNSCSGLRRAADEISELLLIPVIQGALYSATQLSKSNGPEADLIRAEGFVYSRAILPLVASANWGASETIDSYLGFPAPSSTDKTASRVFSAFSKAFPKMDVECELIGKIEGNDPCDGVVYDDGNDNLLWIILGSVLGVCFLFTSCMLWRRTKRSSKLPENNPNFVPHETGELNHSMDLLEKAFSRNDTAIRTPNSTETVALAEDMYNDASPPVGEWDDEDFEEVAALKSNSSDII